MIHFPSEVEVFAERDARCDDATPLPPVFGIYIREAAIPFFPDAARANGIEGMVRIGVTYKGVLSLADGPTELGEPLIEWIRDWTLVPGPYSEEMRFKFTLVDGDCRGGGPIVTIGPGLTSYEITDKRVVQCADGPGRPATSSRLSEARAFASRVNRITGGSLAHDGPFALPGSTARLPRTSSGRNCGPGLPSAEVLPSGAP